MALRNVIHRRNHKERAQPGHRRKLGLLEKHKDYVERARDHHSKQDRLKRLQQKAALRNADEFNFGMLKAGGSRNAVSAAEALMNKKRGAGAAHIQRRPDSSLDNDVVSLLKTQDLGYVRSALCSEEKKIKQLCEQIRPCLAFMSHEWLHGKDGRQETLARQGLLGPDKGTGTGKRKARSSSPDASSKLGTQGKKTIWVDSVDAARSYKPGQSSPKSSSKGKAKHEYDYSLDMDVDDDDDWDKDSDDGDVAVDGGSSSSDAAAAGKRLGKLVSELNSRQARADALHEARQKLETVRSLMTTRGQTMTKKQGGKADALKDAVARGKVTANGLALPGNDDDDDDDDESDEGVNSKKKGKVVWKWGRERKR